MRKRNGWLTHEVWHTQNLVYRIFAIWMNTSIQNHKKYTQTLPASASHPRDLEFRGGKKHADNHMTHYELWNIYHQYDIVFSNLQTTKVLSIFLLVVFLIDIASSAIILNDSHSTARGCYFASHVGWICRPRLSCLALFWASSQLRKKNDGGL